MDSKTTAMMHYLEQSQGTRINVGVTRATHYGGDDMYILTGVKHPIMQIHEDMEGPLWGTATQRAKLIAGYNNGATLVVISFNPFNPSSLCSGGCGTKDKTGTPIARIKEGQPDRLRWTAYLDALATELNTLSASGIPVILRLPQECNGNWFWWGADNTAADYIWLARDIVTYIRDTKGVHNVAYMYSPDFNPAVTDPIDVSHPYDSNRYPGNDYVDIYAASLYMATTDYTNTARLSAAYAEISRAATANSKVWGIAEGFLTFTGTTYSDEQKRTIWTWYANFILNDTNAKNAAFINFWSVDAWWPSAGRLDLADFLRWQADPKYSRFIWGYGSAVYGIKIQ